MKHKRASLFIILALLVLAGCATTQVQRPAGLIQPKKEAQVQQPEIKTPDLEVPLCFNSLPLGEMFKKDFVGFHIILDPDFLVKYGFSSINGKAVPRTTFPAIIENVSWAWVEIKKYRSFLQALLYIPNHNAKNGSPEKGDVYLLTEFKDGYLLIPEKDINWSRMIDLSGKSEEGKSNLRNLLTRFWEVNMIFQDQEKYLVTDLLPRQYREQLKWSSHFRQLIGSAPPVSPTLIFPVTWIPYGISWIGSATAAGIKYGGDNIASVKEIASFLKTQNQSNPEIKLLWKALKKRKGKAEQKKIAARRESRGQEWASE